MAAFCFSAVLSAAKQKLDEAGYSDPRLLATLDAAQLPDIAAMVLETNPSADDDAVMSGWLLNTWRGSMTKARKVHSTNVEELKLDRCRFCCALEDSCRRTALEPVLLQIRNDSAVRCAPVGWGCSSGKKGHNDASQRLCRNEEERDRWARISREILIDTIWVGTTWGLGTDDLQRLLVQ